MTAVAVLVTILLVVVLAVPVSMLVMVTSVVTAFDALMTVSRLSTIQMQNTWIKNYLDVVISKGSYINIVLTITNTCH